MLNCASLLAVHSSPFTLDTGSRRGPWWSVPSDNLAARRRCCRRISRSFFRLGADRPAGTPPVNASISPSVSSSSSSASAADGGEPRLQFARWRPDMFRRAAAVDAPALFMHRMLGRRRRRALYRANNPRNFHRNLSIGRKVLSGCSQVDCRREPPSLSLSLRESGHTAALLILPCCT